MDLSASTLNLNHVAVVGYSCLFVFSILQVRWTLKNPLDLLANILLLVGLASLIMYHVNLLQGLGDERVADCQRRLRLLAHACLTGFLVITALHWSNSKFQYYDGFALAAHAFLFVAVYAAISQWAGGAALAVYFVLTIYHNAKKGGLEWVQLTGRMLMALFFTVSSVKAF